VDLRKVGLGYSFLEGRGMSEENPRNYFDQMQNLVHMLEEQMNLDEIMRQSNLEIERSQQGLYQNQIYEPVVMTNRAAIHFGKLGVRVDSFVKIEGGTGVHIGAGTHIASFAHIGIGGGQVIIEEFCAVASGGKIISGSNQPDAISMSASSFKEMQRVARGVVIMKKYSCVLTNAVVLPGVTLHEGSILAAGAVATKDIPAWEIWGGVPAKFISKREIKR